MTVLYALTADGDISDFCDNTECTISVCSDALAGVRSGETLAFYTRSAAEVYRSIRNGADPTMFGVLTAVGAGGYLAIDSRPAERLMRVERVESLGTRYRVTWTAATNGPGEGTVTTTESADIPRSTWRPAPIPAELFNNPDALAADIEESNTVRRAAALPADVPAEAPTEAARPERSIPAGNVIPRTAEQATTLASRLQDLARFLPGGELESIAHEHAANMNLCGEYEAIVCPTFGWTPRNGEESSMMRRTSAFFSDLDAFEVEHAALSPIDRLNRWMERYRAGGFANRAVVEHAESHLESYKIDSLNELLTDTLGWEPVETNREYEVEVRVERTRTITEYTYVTISADASDESAASDYAYDVAIDRATDAFDWQEYDEDITWGDVNVTEVTLA